MQAEKITQLTPFAIAVAEAMTARAVWLGKVKQARSKARSITHEEYTAVYGAYVKARKRTREAVAEYQRAKNEIRNGATPTLKPKLSDWLATLNVCGSMPD